jgi:predicted dehydrogenase
MDTVRTAVIGTGYLGRFHADKYADIEGSELIAVVDLDLAAAQTVAERHGCLATFDYREILDQVDAVSIVVPTSLHHRVARDCLERGIHVLVEKPITSSVEQADELIALAREHGCVLQVGHLERFNAVLLDLDKVLERPLFIESSRLAPFKPRATDVSVVLDLMIHDIDIILDVVDSDIEHLDASGISVLTDAVDIANARLRFANGCVANVTASRISLKSERKIRLFQQDSYISADFQNRVLSVHRKGSGEQFPGVPEIVSDEIAYEDGDALRAEIVDFLECIRSGRRPLVDGEAGRRALSMATRITELVHSATARQHQSKGSQP